MRPTVMSAPAPSAEAWSLTCAGLTVRRGVRTILHEISLSVSAGETLHLIGPNGSGKTTLIAALLGLLPTTRGTVRLNGAELQRIKPHERARFSAYVPQTIELAATFRVWDVVAGGRYPHVSPLRPLSQHDHDVIDAALRTCGLYELAQRPMHTLSGGERQKAFIAAALAQEPAALFLDEPTSALDPAVKGDLVALLDRWRSPRRALVIVSHQFELPAGLGGRVVALRGGRLVCDLPASAALQPEVLSDVYGCRFELAQTPDGRRVVVPELRMSTGGGTEP